MSTHTATALVHPNIALAMLVQFEQVYAKAPADKIPAVQAFRANYPASTIKVGGQDWEYLAIGKGPQTIVFLHGMTGSYDIW